MYYLWRNTMESFSPLFLLLGFVYEVVPANGQLSRTSPPPGSVVCPGARVEYTCQTGESGGISALTWSIDGEDLSAFIGQLSMITRGDTRNFSGGVVTLTDVNQTSGFTSTFVIDSAGEGVTNRTVIGCTGINVNDETMTLGIVSTEVTSVTLSPPGLTVSTIQVGVATPEAEMCTDTVYCVDVPELNIMNHCTQSRTISLPQELNLCQRNYSVTAYKNGSTTRVSTMVVGDPSGLDSVTDVMSNSTHLFWSPPPNRPEDCVTGYEISWDGGSFIHSPSDENMPSVSFDELKRNRFPVCETVDVTISPFLPALGVLRDKNGTISGVRIDLDELQITNTSLLFIASTRANVTVEWKRYITQPNLQNGDSCFCSIRNLVRVSCDNETFSRCEIPVDNGSNLIGRALDVSISIQYKDCEIISNTSSIQGPTIITTAPVIAEIIPGSSVSVTLNLNRTVVSSNPTPAINITPSGPFFNYDYSTDQLIVNFTGFSENTEYEYSISLSRLDPPICGAFRTRSTPEVSQQLSRGGAIAVSVIITALVTFFLGLTVGVAVTYLCTKHHQNNESTVGSVVEQPGHSGPVYDEVSPSSVKTEKFEMGENMAYGPTAVRL